MQPLVFPASLNTHRWGVHFFKLIILLQKNKKMIDKLLKPHGLFKGPYLLLYPFPLFS